MTNTFARSVRGATAFSCESENGYISNSIWTAEIDELLRIRNLEDNWDGEGSKAPSVELVDGAIMLTKSFNENGLPTPDRVHASVNGTIYFEWHTPASYMEIEVVSPTRAECRRVNNGSNVPEEMVMFFPRSQTRL